MDTIERLAGLFEKFPGIGPRQAQRFVHYLLRAPASLRNEIAHALQELGSRVRQCTSCMRFHAGERSVCALCADARRDASLLMVVASDADALAMERSGTYGGRYFVLGGTISLASETTDGLRVAQLRASLPKRIGSGLREIILAFPANPEGDATTSHLRQMIDDLHPSLRVTTLGRGLSTGSELEYADPETLKNALDSRR